MKCPVCTTVDLMMTDRNGVEIDSCQQCRGVWLDRGELDKIIERAASLEQGTTLYVSPSGSPSPMLPARKSKSDYDDHYDHDDRYDDDRNDNRGYPPKKRKSFLGDMFDIFD